MRRSYVGFLGPAAWLPVFTIGLCMVPAVAFADAACVTGSTGGPCPGFFAGPPFAVPFLPVPEGSQQSILPPGVFVTAGDVLVFDDPAMTILGDVLRFPDIGGGVAHFVILLSDPPDPEDTGLPASFQPNTFSMVENAGGPTLYTAGPGGQVYNILSDSEVVADVPEPGTFSLLALAGMAFLSRLWRKRLLKLILLKSFGFKVRNGRRAASSFTRSTIRRGFRRNGEAVEAMSNLIYSVPFGEKDKFQEFQFSIEKSSC